MHSTIVKDREDAARDLLATLQLHGKRVGAKLAEVFGPLLKEGETLPDYVQLQQFMARTVRARLLNLQTADAAHLAVVEQLEDEGVRDREQPFLRARSTTTKARRQAATAAFDEVYFGFGEMLGSLYSLAGEEEIAESLRPRALADGVEQPAAALAYAEPPEPSEEPAQDQVQRRILSRKLRRRGLSRWMGVRIFRCRRP